MTALQQEARGGTTDPATGSSDDDDFVHVDDSRSFMRAQPRIDKHPTPRTNAQSKPELAARCLSPSTDDSAMNTALSKIRVADWLRRSRHHVVREHDSTMRRPRDNAAAIKF